MVAKAEITFRNLTSSGCSVMSIVRKSAGGSPDTRGVFVELEVLALDAAEDHGGEPAVAEGQRVGRFFGGRLIPEREPGRGSRVLAGGACARTEGADDDAVEQAFHARDGPGRFAPN